MSTSVWTIVCDDTRKTSQVYFGEIVTSTVDGVHDIACGTAINGELLAGQHDGQQTQRSSNGVHFRGESCKEKRRKRQ